MRRKDITPPTVTCNQSNPTFTVGAAATLTATVGDQALETHTDSNSAGVAEAFHFTATSSGTLDHLSVYRDRTSRASRVVIGIYNGTASHPNALLG